jgi:DNA-binding transcriptional regulator GbsR (MarR family)
LSESRVTLPDKFEDHAQRKKEPPRKPPMDKKSKKRIDVIRSQLQRLRLQLSGARQQKDDLQESKDLAQQIAALETELKSLTEASNANKK